MVTLASRSSVRSTLRFWPRIGVKTWGEERTSFGERVCVAEQRVGPVEHVVVERPRVDGSAETELTKGSLDHPTGHRQPSHHRLQARDRTDSRREGRAFCWACSINQLYSTILVTRSGAAAAPRNV